MSEPTEIRFRLPRAAFEVSVDLRLPAAGVTAFYGPSGAGKTSILRCVAGLEQPQDARICVQGQCWQDDAQQVFLPTWRRPIGYVFQEASLFDHLDVRGNLEYGMRRAGVKDSGVLQPVVELLGIGELLSRRPDRLSGGERQRVAIARALATRPGLLLLDEPLAALDSSRRQEVLPWLERLRDELRVPMLYVSHSVDEVARLADTLVLLEAGQVRSLGPVADVLVSAPLAAIAGDELGAVLDAVIEERDLRWHQVRARIAGGMLWLADRGLAAGQKVRLRVLARDVSITTEEPRSTSIQNPLAGRIVAIDIDRHPSQVLVQVDCHGSRLVARVSGRSAEALGLVVGRAVWAQVKSAAIVS
jgi:molybdate transport system ATP-binding protein